MKKNIPAAIDNIFRPSVIIFLVYSIKLPSVSLGVAYEWAETTRRQPRVASAEGASRGLERSSSARDVYMYVYSLYFVLFSLTFLFCRPLLQLAAFIHIALLEFACTLDMI